MFLFGAGYEARTRFPASHELRSAIRRNPASPLIKMRFAHGCRYRVLFVNEKNQGIQSDVLIYSGAGYEARTRYLHLGKVALYQMS